MVINMRPEDLLDWVRAVPFQPFRICLVSGRSYDVRHPEMVKVGRSTMHIYQFASEAYEVYDRADMVGLILIEHIEPILSESAA